MGSIPLVQMRSEGLTWATGRRRLYQLQKTVEVRISSPFVLMRLGKRVYIGSQDSGCIYTPFLHYLFRVVSEL